MTGTTLEEGAVVAAVVQRVNSTSQSAAELQVLQHEITFHRETYAWSELKHFGRGI